MARRIDLRRGHMAGSRDQAPTTQMGIRGCCTGRGRNVTSRRLKLVALEGEGLAAPEPFEDGERLVEHGRAGAAVELVAAEPGALVGRGAQADGEGEAPSGEVVEGGGLARDQPGGGARRGGVSIVPRRTRSVRTAIAESSTQASAKSGGGWSGATA